MNNMGLLLKIFSRKERNTFSEEVCYSKKMIDFGLTQIPLTNDLSRFISSPGAGRLLPSVP